MLRKVLIYHLIPFTIACLGVFFLLDYSSILGQKKTIIIAGTQTKIRGYDPNLLAGDSAEINYFSSIKNKQQLTLFGSSEFSSTPYCSHYFLPDSLGIKSYGLGHAYHQNLSILCELLAADEYLENSKICIILSLGWFNTKGTNTSAFIEFVRPNLLQKIINNPTIDLKHKQYIGQYINEHKNEISALSNEMKVLESCYLTQQSNFLNKLKNSALEKIQGTQNHELKYETQLSSNQLPFTTIDYAEISTRLQKEFVESITSNSIYVYDEYYNRYLVEEDGKEKHGNVEPFELENNQELNDFRQLIQYLKSKNTDCSFVIQPVNPYYYDHVENYNPLCDTLTSLLEKNNFPYLNLHVSNKEDYEPGILKDVMHLGDYGWMKVNYFLDSLYHEDRN